MSDVQTDILLPPTGEGLFIPDALEIRGLAALSPDDYNSLLGFLNHMGLAVEPVEDEPDVLLGEEDFKRVAEACNFANGVSARTWGRLSGEWANYLRAKKLHEISVDLAPFYEKHLKSPIGRMALFNEFDLIIFSRLEEARESKRLYEGVINGLGAVSIMLIDAVIDDTNQRLRTETQT